MAMGQVCGIAGGGRTGLSVGGGALSAAGALWLGARFPATGRGDGRGCVVAERAVARAP